jgi:CRISPR-associated protein Cmr4
MYQVSKPLFLVAETPLHAGSGDDLGVVDLPIQRERHTQYPKIEASSLKGALREAFETKLRDEATQKLNPENSKLIAAAFGPESDEMKDGTFAACLGFTDARILLFPVKSMKGVFAWVTCPHVLHRFSKELEQSGNKGILGIPDDVEEGKAYYTIDTCTNIVKNKDKEEFVVLEEYSFSLKPITKPVNIDGSPLGKWLADNIFEKGDIQKYWKTKISKDIIIVSDDDFKAFVEHSTEVITRIKINNETGTAQEGALFNEEYLPSESIMYSIVLASREFQKERINFKEAGDTMKFFIETLDKNLKNIFQLGGNATLGKGILHAKTL